jgi:hypothetical protein
MDFDFSAQIDEAIRTPRAPEVPKPAPKWSGWSAPARAVPAAAAEMLAGGVEAVTSVGRGLRTMDEQTNTREKRRAFGGLSSLPSGETELSRAMRDVAEHYAPDPTTATKAEQIVFGLTRGVGKAVAYGLTTGPAAPFLFGADEGMTTADSLQRQGVDRGTAAKAGAVAAVVNAAGFAVPVAGKTVAGTFGLATVAGPASFMAQNAGTREILNRADYHEQAKAFDPLDPAGLALSALPYGFGAWAMKARKPPTPIASIKNEGELKKAAQFTPEEQARSAAYEASPDNLRVLKDAIKAEKRPEARALLEAELRTQEAAAKNMPVRQIEPTTVAAAPDVGPRPTQEHVDAAMAHNLTLAADHAETFTSKPLESLDEFAARVIQRADPKRATAGPDPFLAWLNAQGGVNIADKFDITGEANAVRLNRGRVFKSTGLGVDEIAIRAEAEGWIPQGSTQDIDGGVPQVRDMLQRSMQGERVRDLRGQADEAAATGERYALEQHVMALEQRLETLGIDPAPARGDHEILQAYLDQHEPRLIRQALAEQYEPDLSGLPEPTNPNPIKKGADAPETANPGTQEAQARGPQDAPAAGQQARAVEQSAPGAAAGTPGAVDGPDAALIQSARARADQVVAASPDLIVGMDADGNPITALEALEQIRKEAAEGTDKELGANDAPLLDAAIQCALRQGE